MTMEIEKQYLEQIHNFLDLEKIIVQEKTILYLTPKKINKDFNEKLVEVEKYVKQISSKIEIKIIEEGEIDNDYKFLTKS